MRGQNVCFLWANNKIIPKLSLLALLIWSMDINLKTIDMYAKVVLNA